MAVAVFSVAWAAQQHDYGVLFRITEEARSLMVRKAPAGEIRRLAVAQGMVTLRGDAWAKACAGLTTVEEILRVTQEDT